MNKGPHHSSVSMNMDGIDYRPETDIPTLHILDNEGTGIVYDNVLTRKSAKCVFENETSEVKFKFSIKKLREEEENLTFNRKIVFHNSTTSE